MSAERRSGSVVKNLYISPPSRLAKIAHKIHISFYGLPMDIKLILAVLTGLFVVATLFFGTKNGFYDTESYHGNGSAH